MNSALQETTASRATRPWAARPLADAVYEAAVAEGRSHLQATVIAGRLNRLPDGRLADLINPRAADLPRASALPDIALATACLADAIEQGQVIAAVLDHDADGQNSGLVIWRAMTEAFAVPPERLHVVTSHRLKEGYGVSSQLVERILALDPRPTCVLTADQGSTDEPRVAELARHGVKTVVTDHHHLPEEGPPPSAVACVNPARDDATAFGDPTICGAMVAWYVMVALQRELARRGLPHGTPAQLVDLLSFVAVATCGDCVDLGMSHANRWAVQQGLERIERGGQAIWEAFAPFVRNEWTSTSLSFQIVPRLNSVGRLGDAKRGIEAMCSSNLREAYAWVQTLDDANLERKRVQAELTERAMEMAQPQMDQGAPALCLPFYTGGHAGVHGITASRIVDTFGVPTVCLSPVEGDPDWMTGSIRSVEGAHVKHLLDGIAREYPQLNLRYGGHAMAGGVKVPRALVSQFAIAWELAVQDALTDRPPPPREHDGKLPVRPSRQAAAELAELAPYGRGFPEPVFVVAGEVSRIRPLGRDNKHLQMDVAFPDGQRERMVWFNAVGEDGQLPIGPGHHRFAYQLTGSTFARGPGYDLKIVACLDGTGESD